MRLPDGSRSRAVLVGVSRYESAGLRDLPAVAHNLTELRGILVDPARSTFTTRTCVRVTDPRTANDMLGPIHDAARAAEDVLLVYVACHGLLLGGQRDLHLAVAATDPAKSWTAVRYEQVAEVLRDSDAAVKVVLLDCCYSGRATRVALSGDPATGGIEQVDIEGTYVLTSASGTRESFVADDGRHTAFTGAVLAELRSTVDGPGGLLPMVDLFPRVRARLAKAGYPEPQQFNRNSAGQLALVRVPAAPAPPPAPSPRALPPAASPPTLFPPAALAPQALAPRVAGPAQRDRSGAPAGREARAARAEVEERRRDAEVADEVHRFSAERDARVQRELLAERLRDRQRRVRAAGLLILAAVAGPLAGVALLTLAPFDRDPLVRVGDAAAGSFLLAYAIAGVGIPLAAVAWVASARLRRRRALVRAVALVVAAVSLPVLLPVAASVRDDGYRRAVDEGIRQVVPRGHCGTRELPEPGGEWVAVTVMTDPTSAGENCGVVAVYRAGRRIGEYTLPAGDYYPKDSDWHWVTAGDGLVLVRLVSGKDQPYLVGLAAGDTLLERWRKNCSHGDLAGDGPELTVVCGGKHSPVTADGVQPG